MVSIRLARRGARKRPFYHIVATDRRNKSSGRALERLGFFNPCAAGPEEALRIDTERLAHWVGQGGQLSPRVRDLLARYRRGAPVTRPLAAATPAPAQATASGAAATPAPESVEAGPAQAASSAAATPTSKSVEAEPAPAEEAESKPAQVASSAAVTPAPKSAEAGDQAAARTPADEPGGTADK